MNDRPTSSNAWLSKLQHTRLPVWVTLLFLVLLVAVFSWQRVAVSRAEARLADERAAMQQKFAADRIALIEQVRQRAAATTDETRRRFAMALAWAVRGEMIRNNLDQVDQYFAELVKLPGHKLVLLAERDGKVRVATDRKHLGADAASLVPSELLTRGEISIHDEGQGTRLLAIPVMGLNTRMGTVLLRYVDTDPVAGI